MTAAQLRAAIDGLEAAIADWRTASRTASWVAGIAAGGSVADMKLGDPRAIRVLGTDRFTAGGALLDATVFLEGLRATVAFDADKDKERGGPPAPPTSDVATESAPPRGSRRTTTAAWPGCATGPRRGPIPDGGPRGMRAPGDWRAGNRAHPGPSGPRP